MVTTLKTLPDATRISFPEIKTKVLKIEKRIAQIRSKHILNNKYLEAGKKLVLGISIITLVSGFPAVAIVSSAFYGALLDESWKQSDNQNKALLYANRNLTALLSSISKEHSTHLATLKKIESHSIELQNKITLSEKNLSDIADKTSAALDKLTATQAKLSQTEVSLKKRCQELLIIKKALAKEVSCLKKQVDRLTQIS